MRYSWIFCLSVVLFPLGALKASAQTFPAIEYSSLIEGIHIHRETGKLTFHGLVAAFLPKPEHWVAGDPTRSGGHSLDAVLSQNGRELVKIPFDVDPGPGAFSGVRARGADLYRFQESGTYTLSFLVDGVEITRLDFETEVSQGDDPFDPKTLVDMGGPWGPFAYLYSELASGEDSPVNFRVWMKPSPSHTKGPMELQVVHQGEIIARAKASFFPDSRWSRQSFQLTYRKDQGGRVFPLKALLAHDGDYLFRVGQGDVIHTAFVIKVQGGKMVAHPRQKIGYQPTTQYLVGRRLEPDGNSGSVRPGNIIWTEALDQNEIARHLSSGRLAPTEVEAETRAGWTVPSPIDASRPFQVKITQVPLRHDGALAASDKIMAYGTGGFSGVEYVRVGEEEPRSIPNGGQFMSKLIWVCDAKIILVKSKQLFVYDTEADRLSPVPMDEITLPHTKGGPGKPNIIAADGNLVACVCDESKVTDHRSIKVLDVSSSEPRVMSVRTEGVIGKEVVSIAIDASTARVVFGLKSKAQLGVAPVAPNSLAQMIDLSAHDSIGTEQLFLSHSKAFYVDASSARRLRFVDLEKQAVESFSPEGVGAKGVCYRLVGDHLAYASSPGSGSLYPFMVGTLAGAKKGAGLGEEGEGNCKLGFGSRVAISPDGTAFVSGDGSLGSGETLQACVGGQWMVIKDDKGEAIKAGDLAIGGHTLVFKTGKSTKTTLGYATFGEKIRNP